MKVNILIVFALLLIFACSNHEKSDLNKPLVFRNGLLYQDSLTSKPFTGRNKSKMLNQTIEYDVVNGVKEGDFITYYSNGKAQMIGKIRGNKNIGLWKYYYNDGSLQTAGFFKDDKPDSIWKWYSYKGYLMEEGCFKDGKRDGEWKNYDSIGKIKSIKIFENDKLVDSTEIN